MSTEQVNLLALNAAIIAVTVLLAFGAGWLFLSTRNGWIVVGFFVVEAILIAIGKYWVRPKIIRNALDLGD